MNHSPYPASVEKQVSLLQLQIVEKIHERTITSFTCPSPSRCPLSRRRSRAQKTRDHGSPPCHTRFWSARGAGHTPQAVIGTDLLLSSTQQDKKLWERLIWWWCRLFAISSDSKGCTTVRSVNSQAVPYSSEASQGFASASKAGCDFVLWATGSAFLLNKRATLHECEKEVVAEVIKALPFYSRKALLNYTPRKQD